MFSRIPKNPEIAKKWQDVLGNEVANFQGSVCIEHFTDDCLKAKKSKNRAELKPNSIPTVFNVSDIPTPGSTSTTRLTRVSDHCKSHRDITSPTSMTSAPSSTLLCDTSDNDSIEPSTYSTSPLVEINRKAIDHCKGHTNRASPVPMTSAPSSTLLCDTRDNDSIEPSTSTTSPTVGIDRNASDHCKGHIFTSSSIDKVVDERIWCTKCIEKDEIIEKKDLEIQNLRKKLKAAQKKNWHLESTKRKLDDALSKLKNDSLIDEKLYQTLEVCVLSILVILKLWYMNKNLYMLLFESSEN